MLVKWYHMWNTLVRACGLLAVNKTLESLHSSHHSCIHHTIHAFITQFMHSSHHSCIHHTIHAFITPFMHSSHPYEMVLLSCRVIWMNFLSRPFEIAFTLCHSDEMISLPYEITFVVMSYHTDAVVLRPYTETKILPFWWIFHQLLQESFHFENVRKFRQNEDIVVSVHMRYQHLLCHTDVLMKSLKVVIKPILQCHSARLRHAQPFADIGRLQCPDLTVPRWLNLPAGREPSSAGIALS